MEYKVEFVDGYFDVKLTGKPDVKDSAAYLDCLIAHEQWQPGSLVLSDDTDFEAGQLTQSDLMRIANVCGERRAAMGFARIAAVVPRELVFGMNRMFQVYVEPYWDVKSYAFRSREEALAWLLSV